METQRDFTIISHKRGFGVRCWMSCGHTGRQAPLKPNPKLTNILRSPADGISNAERLQKGFCQDRCLCRLGCRVLDIGHWVSEG